MTGHSVVSLIVIVLGMTVCWAQEITKFDQVSITQQFQPYLLSNPLVMEIAGAKVIREKGGRTVLISVASTVLRDASPKDRLRAEKVCRTKALAGIVAEKTGIQVCHTESLKESTVVVIDKAKETESSVSELLHVTTTRVQGIVKDMPVVGRWLSKDGNVYYLAIGVIVDREGEVVEPVEPEE